MAQFALHNAIALIYVNAVREFFTTHALADGYRYSDDVAKRKVEIVKQWPDQPQTFPLIVIDVVYSQSSERYLADSAGRLEVNGRHEGLSLSGVDDFDVRITINDHSKAGVDDVADILVFALKRHIEANVWAASNMTVIPQRNDRTAGAGARPFTDGSLVYFITVSCPVKTHWFDEIIYDQRILTYLATVEREGLEAAATSFQIQAGDG